MKLWIARDKDEILYLYTHEPELTDDKYFASNGDYCNIDNTKFPEVTFENSPQQIEIKLIK